MAETLPDISVSLESVNWKLAAIAEVIDEDPRNESLYYVLFAVIQSIVSSSSKLLKTNTGWAIL